MVNRRTPPFSEHIVAQDTIPHTAMSAMDFIIGAARVGNYNLYNVLFAGIDGQNVARTGTFGDEDSIFAASVTDWEAEARLADRTQTPAQTSFDDALHCSNLPALVILKRAAMSQIDNAKPTLWCLGDEPNGKIPCGSLFDRAVASVVYFPDDAEGVEKILNLTGLSRNRVFRPKTSRVVTQSAVDPNTVGFKTEVPPRVVVLQPKLT